MFKYLQSDNARRKTFRAPNPACDVKMRESQRSAACRRRQWVGHLASASNTLHLAISLAIT